MEKFELLPKVFSKIMETYCILEISEEDVHVFAAGLASLPGWASSALIHVRPEIPSSAVPRSIAEMFVSSQGDKLMGYSIFNYHYQTDRPPPA